jgi:putative SOS response-associated peptidase YedK
MCGRYALPMDSERVSVTLGAGWRGFPAPGPRYNIAPTQSAPVLLRDAAGVLALDLFRWGLIPSWARDGSIGGRMINARCETVSEKPAFRAAFRARRCLVPAGGFYEWQRTGEGKIPQWIHAADGDLLTFAGLWERWDPPDAEPVFSFTILTTTANPFLAPVHDRMPVLVTGSDRARWLEPGSTREELVELLRPAEDGLLSRYAVSTLVNSPRNEGEQLLERHG